LVLCLVLCNLINSSFDDRKLIIQRDRETDRHTKHAQPHRHKPGVSLRWVAEEEMKYKPVPKRILNKDIMNGADLPQTKEPPTKKHTNKDIINGDDLPSATRMSSAAMTLHQHQMVVDDDGGRNTRQRKRETQQECQDCHQAVGAPPGGKLEGVGRALGTTGRQTDSERSQQGK